MNFSSIHSVVDLCQALVQIPSENPSGSTVSHGEEAIARFVGEFLQSIGAQVEYEDIGPGRPNVYGLWPVPPGATQRILFAPHLDTVTVDGMTVDPFLGKPLEGRLYGRGSSDTKGPMAAMLWALKSVDLSKLDVADAMVTAPAWASAPVPYGPPPMKMLPPPIAPEASNTAAPTVTVAPVTLIAPPRAFVLVALKLAYDMTSTPGSLYSTAVMR